MKRTIKIASVAISTITAIYTMWYMHYGDPTQNSGALSKIGLEHKGLFIIWGVMTYISLALGIALAYGKKKMVVYIPLLILSGIGMALTLGFDFDYNIKPDYYLHCVGSLLFSASMGANIFLLFLLNYAKGKIYEAGTYISGGILMVDLMLLLIFKETGLIEAVPILAGYILLATVNLRRDKVEATK